MCVFWESDSLSSTSLQTLNIQTEDSKNNLTFIPLAPACVVSSCLYLLFKQISEFEDTLNYLYALKWSISTHIN